MTKQKQFAAINDPKNYRALLEPFASAEEANDALNGFWDELYALRNKYELPDVYVVVSAKVTNDEGAEGDTFCAMHAGSELVRESMAAWAFGYEVSQRQGRLRGLMERQFVRQPESKP